MCSNIYSRRYDFVYINSLMPNFAVPVFSILIRDFIFYINLA